MSRLLRYLDRQSTLFILGLVLCGVMAGLGWNKLSYGFNFIDEGMYMTDGWRLTVGDNLFPDSPTSVTLMYAVLNAGVFHLFPDITLLSFRKLQYVMAILCLTVFSLSVCRWSREYWFAPFVMSVFAFTGLDAIGMSANLSYYTYPHMFLTLHIATLLFALKSTNVLARNMLLVLAGVFLWAVGFSLLPLSLGVVSPFLTWLLLRRRETDTPGFGGRDVLLVTAPVVILWVGILAAYNIDFIAAMSDSQRYVSEGDTAGVSINTRVLPYLAVTAAFMILILIGTRLKALSVLLVTVALSVTMFFILDTNLFGLISLYWRGWFAAQMWFSALAIVSLAAFFSLLRTKVFRAKFSDDRTILLLVLLVPASVFAALFSNFSGMGILSTSYVSIPVVMALGILIIGWMDGIETRLSLKAAAITAIFFPFYYNLAWADWKFTYFDVPPSKMTHTISTGFGTGIKTNFVFHDIAEWMEKNADQYSDPTDFAIVLDQTPMGYMLIKRRPALNHSYTGWGASPSLRREAVTAMIREKRVPRIAFRFVRAPMFFPTSLKEGTFAIAGRRNFGANDPVSNYIQENMVLTEKIQIQGEIFVELFVRPAPDATVRPAS